MTDASPLTGDPRTAGDPSCTLPVVEERLAVAVLRRALGTVRLRTVTEEVEALAEATLASVRVEVTRVPVGRDVEAAPEIRVEDGVTIIPVLEERLVLRRQLVLAEEIHLREVRTAEATSQPVSLRRQRVVVERTGPDASDGTPDVQITPERKDDSNG